MDGLSKSKDYWPYLPRYGVIIFSSAWNNLKKMTLQLKVLIWVSSRDSNVY